MDRIIRGITKDKSIRFFAIDATKSVQEAVTIHHLSMTNSVIMGRMISATLMMAADLKSDKNVITLKIDCDGPVGTAIVTARKNGNVKGYLKYPEVEIPLNEHTKTFDIQRAIGDGTLTIIKDLGMKNPYIGQIELKYSTIAKDLTYYFAQSEQIPSSVGLGVLVMPDGTVKKVGGFIIQVLPQTSEEVISQIEENLAKFPNLTDMMDLEHSIEDIISKFILKGLEPEIKETSSVKYKCDCSKEKFEDGIRLLSKKELQEAIDTNETLTIHCHFCNTDYNFDKNKIEKILKEM
ncbi:MAG: Hsp33 family molecular chaperone HslO [Candidatus Tenebribacter burtonii]|jgi:molecular chaperone Hsp33|nr:Hsp33 family molecular chaperone HslO [Candidatus Tenebribacter burtonii]